LVEFGAMNAGTVTPTLNDREVGVAWWPEISTIGWMGRAAVVEFSATMWGQSTTYTTEKLEWHGGPEF